LICPQLLVQRVAFKFRSLIRRNLRRRFTNDEECIGGTGRLARNTGGMQGVFNEAERNVMVARCASSGGVLGVENVVGIQVQYSSFSTSDNDTLVHELARFRGR